MSRARLLYDADCGFCVWALAPLLRLDRDGQIQPLPLQSGEAARLLAPMSEYERMASWHLVEPDGRVHSGGDAFAPLFERLPRLRRLAPLAARLRPLLRVGYRLVAASRTRIGPLIRHSAKRRARARVERH